VIKKIISNTLANYLLKAIQLLLGLIAVPVLIQGVGEEGFGIITFAAVVIGYFNIFDLGISQGVTKYVSQFLAAGDNKKVSEVINTSFGLFIIIGLIICSIVLIGLQFDALNYLNLEENNYEAGIQIFTVAAFMAIFMWPRLVLEGAFRGIQDFTTLNLTIGFGRIFSMALAIVLTKYFQLSLLYIFIAFNFDKIVLLFLQYFLLRRKLPFWRFKWSEVNKSTFNLIFAFSGWVMLSQVALLLEYQTDQLIIVSFIGVSAVTTYVVVFYLFNLIQQISGLACSAIMPVVSEVQAGGNRLLIEKFIYNGSRYHNLLFAPIVIVIFYLSEPFFRLWMGGSYLEYIWLVKLTILFQLIWQSNAFLGSVCYGLGMSKKLGIIALLVGLANVMLSIVLTYYLGLPGVILGTIIVGSLSVAVEYIWLFPDLEINIKKYLISVFIKAQLPFLIVLVLIYPAEQYFNWIGSWSQLIVVGALFTGVIYYIGYLFSMNKEEKSTVNQAVIKGLKKLDIWIPRIEKKC